MRDGATADVASSMAALDAALDAARRIPGCDASSLSCLNACAAIDCIAGFVCQLASCEGANCVRQAQCMRVVQDCSECSFMDVCWQAACFGDPSKCPTVCEHLTPKCTPSCAQGSKCEYDGEACDDAGTCKAVTRCMRPVESEADCAANETFRRIYYVDGYDVPYCVAN